MNPLLRLFAVLLLLATSSPSTQPSTAQSAAVPVAAVWHEISYPPPGVNDLRHLIVGVWSDGTIVWGEAKKGGRPYRTAKIDPARAEKLLADLDSIAFFNDGEATLHRNSYPPDASYFAVAASWNDKHQRLASWKNPPASESARFNEVFSKAQELIRSCAPAEGKPIETIDERVFRLGRAPRR